MSKVIDLFSGIGGLSEGFRMAGFDIVLANDIDNEIADSYKKNHLDTVMINEDITKLDINDTFSSYKDIDVIIGGPPCQGFSQKGKRLSLTDPRNFLFHYFYEVVNELNPKYFLMENVPNILTTENGYFKDEILNIFQSIGYSVTTDILDASDYGVPQNRKRAFVLGKRGNCMLNLPDPIEGKKITIWDAISDLAYLNSGEGDFEQTYKINPQSEYQKILRDNSKYLYNHKVTNHSKIALERLQLIPINGGRDSLPEEHLTKSIFSGTWSRMNKDIQSVTITTRFDTPSSGKFTHPFLNRAITVREAARLQSFPDSTVFWGTKGSQMKQVGNAVPPLLAKVIAETIKKDMTEGAQSTCTQ